MQRRMLGTMFLLDLKPTLPVQSVIDCQYQHERNMYAAEISKTFNVD